MKASIRMDVGEFPAAEDHIRTFQWQVVRQPEPLRTRQGDDGLADVDIRNVLDTTQDFCRQSGIASTPI